jgi:uncharacterized coiled-coil protein SlyX
MKNYLVIGAVAIMFASCNQKELDQANQSNDSLLLVANQQNAEINEFLSSFNELEANIDSVAKRQHVITLTTSQQGDLAPTQEERINAEILAINSMMDENRKKLAELNRKLKNSNSANATLQKTIATLNNQLAQKDIELNDLNAKLAALNAQVAQLQVAVTDLSNTNAAQTQTINNDTKTMHTAYYVVGKSKDLATAKIIDRDGGLLGIGKTSKLNADIDNSKYTQIDYTVTTTIAINGKDVSLITTHPSDTYTLEKDAKDKNMVTNLVITNPEKFWSASKYLVIVKK